MTLTGYKSRSTFYKYVVNKDYSYMPEEGDVMNEQKQSYLLSFEGISEAEANKYAAELRENLLRISVDIPDEIIVQRQRNNPLTLDLGSTLVLILGTPAIVATVNAIGNWMQKRHNASLTIMTSEKGEKRVVAEGITHKEVAHLLELFLIQSAEQKEIDE